MFCLFFGTFLKKFEIEMFSKNVGMSIQDFDGVSVEKIAVKALELKREMEK